MRKAVISGATGFVGSNLQTYLQDSYTVETLSRKSIKFTNNFSYNNIENLLSENSSFIHLAGKAHDLKKKSDLNEYYQSNYLLTKTLYDIFLKSEASNFIFISSVKAVADSLDNEKLNEKHIPLPTTNYGKSKLLAEQYILDNPPTDINRKVFILRPCMIHGPNNKGNLNQLYKMVSKGIPWPLGAFDNRRSFCSVENLCFVIKELIEKQDVSSGVYNVADSESISTNELVGIIGKSLQKMPLILSIPTNVIKKMSRIGDFFHLPLNTERLQKLTENYEVSNLKLVKALGKELPINTREGLLQTFKSFSSNG